jgi:hypothetical protein
MARLTSGTPVAQMQDSVKASARTPDASTFNKPVAEWFDRSQPSSPELVTETASKKKKKSEGTVSEGFKDVYDSMEDKNALLWQWVSDAMRPKTQVPVAYNVWK